MTLTTTTAAADPVLDLAGRIAGLDVATTVVAVVVLFLLALHRGWLVTGRQHEEIRNDRDWWRATAVRALNLGERAVASRDER